MRNLIILTLFFFLGIQQTIAQQTDSSEVKLVLKDTSKRSIPPPPPPSPPKEEGIFRIVEEMPRFPGCEGKGSKEEIKKCAERELTKFIYKNLKYPKEAIDNRIEGVCVVQFTVDKTGSVKDVNLVRDIGGGCGEESVRLVELMIEENIRWTPPRSRIRPSSVRFTLPVKFKLGELKTEEN